MYLLKALDFQRPIRITSFSGVPDIIACVQAPIRKLCSLYDIGDKSAQRKFDLKVSRKEGCVMTEPPAVRNKAPG